MHFDILILYARSLIHSNYSAVAAAEDQFGLRNHCCREVFDSVKNLKKKLYVKRAAKFLSSFGDNEKKIINVDGIQKSNFWQFIWLEIQSDSNHSKELIEPKTFLIYSERSD